MSQTDPAQRDEFPPPPNPSDRDWSIITDLKVSSGRVLVPARARDRHGIGEGDVMDVAIYADGRAVFVPEAVVGRQHRILVPPKRVEMNDLEGETVDIAARDTGRDYPGDGSRADEGDG